MTELVASVDVGGTAIKAGLVDRQGRAVLDTRRDTGVELGVDAVVAGILDLAAELTQAGPAGSPVRAVGIGVPGVVDADHGIARYAANLGWRDVPLAALLGARVGLPVALGHDVRNAALAEARLGGGSTGTSMFFLAIGTGIAGGLVEDGVVREGSSGRSGEVGHLVVRPDGPECACGNRGCLETVASASRIAGRYLALTGRPRSAQQIAALVSQGEPAARQIWSEAIDALADALAAVTVLSDPGRIVLGGGLSLAGATLTDPLTAALAARLTFRAPPPISLADLGDRAGLVGAALRGWDLLDRLGTSP